MKQNYRFADVIISAEFSGNYIKSQCREYETCLPAVTNIEITPEDIVFEREYAKKTFPDVQNVSDGYLESVSFHRNLARELSTYGVVLIHASAVMLDGTAYLYSAPSGVGKSTHAGLCRQVFGNRVEIINDDKPFLRKTEEGIFVYGSPWDGKRRLSRNIRAPLGGICLLNRGKDNVIEPVLFKDALPVLISRTYIPSDEIHAEKVMEVLCSLSEVKIWDLHCNVAPDAALLSLNTMNDSRNDSGLSV